MNTEGKKVVVINNTTGRVGVIVPEMNFRRIWQNKGARQLIDMETLEQLMYDDGTYTMFETGMLYIEDLSVKKKLGLEPEEVEQPKNIIVLNEKQKKELLTEGQTWEFKKKIEVLKREEILNLVDYAIEHEIPIKLDRNEIIKTLTGKDIAEAIRLERESKE